MGKRVAGVWVAALLAASCSGGSGGRVAVPGTVGAQSTTSSAVPGSTWPSILPAPTTTTAGGTAIARQVAASLATINRADATAVGAWAARTIWVVDTTTDTDQTDAELRAAAVLTPTYAAGLRALPRPPSPGAEWATWASHRVTTTADAVLQRDAGAPVDTDTISYRSYFVTVTPHAADGWVGAVKTDVEFVTLTKDSGGLWSVSKFGPSPG
jgi:hypothetical protein